MGLRKKYRDAESCKTQGLTNSGRFHRVTLAFYCCTGQEKTLIAKCHLITWPLEPFLLSYFVYMLTPFLRSFSYKINYACKELCDFQFSWTLWTISWKFVDSFVDIETVLFGITRKSLFGRVHAVYLQHPRRFRHYRSCQYAESHI